MKTQEEIAILLAEVDPVPKNIMDELIGALAELKVYGYERDMSIGPIMDLIREYGEEVAKATLKNWESRNA